MKKIYSFMVAAVALFAAASCNKELPQEEVPAVGETVVYTASTDGADTKAVLNETTKKSEWVADDAITVYDLNNDSWTFTTAEAGANVDFSNSEGFGDYRPVMAVYPAGTYTVDVAAKTAKAYIPTWQQAQAGTYHSPAALAVAYTEDNTFAFKNAHALLKFTVNTDNVTHVIFHGNGSEAITGDVNVTLGEDGVESVGCLETEFTEKQWNEETQQNEDVKVNKYGTWVECYAWDDNELVDDPSDDTKYFTKGQTYYIAVAPQKFASGVTVKVRINEGEELVAKTTTKSVETKINTILNLGEIKYEAPATVEKVYLQPGVWSAANAWFSAHFFNSVGGAEDVKMTDDDADGVYEVSVPAGMESVIFCRMNPAYSDFAWNNETETDHVWTEMSSVAIPLADDTKVYYNVTDWEAGEWSDTPQESTPDKPATVEKVYLQPGVWSADNAWFSAHFFNSVGGAEDVKMTDEDTDGVYEVSVPAGMESVIFCRMNPEYTEFGWDVWEGETEVENHVWNQTEDLVLPLAGDDEIYYKVTGWDTPGKWWNNIPESVTPGLESEWALAGTFNSWGNEVLLTTNVADLFVAKNLTFDAGDEIKVKAADSWDVSYGGGIKYLQANKWMTVYSNGANVPVAAAGTYDVYFDLANTKLYLMNVGTSYTSATEQNTDGPTPAAPSNWYIVGNFNGWVPNDEGYRMLDDGTYFIFDNFTAAAGCEMKFAPGKWSGDKGASGSFSANQWLNTGSNNIAVSAGTYKIYFKKDGSQYKFETK